MDFNSTVREQAWDILESIAACLAIGLLNKIMRSLRCYLIPLTLDPSPPRCARWRGEIYLQPQLGQYLFTQWPHLK